MKNYITLLLGFAILISCSAPRPECVNKEKYFDTNTYESQEYQNKVINILHNDSPEYYRYFFVTFTGDDNDYLVVNMRNDKNCFDAKILVTDWTKLAGMRKVNGKAYPKELHDLTWSLIRTKESWKILYGDMRTIRD
jgi:hypothetical protein